MDFIHVEYETTLGNEYEYPDEGSGITKNQREPKNQYYIEKRIEQFNEAEIIQYFRLSKSEQ